MADTKNETGKTSTTDKRAGTDTGGKVSAGSSVGNIGEAPMPQAQTGASNSQGSSASASGQGSSASASGQGSSGQGSANKSNNQSSQQSAQGGSTTGKAQQKASDLYEDASEWAQDTYERVSDWASSSSDRQRRRMSHMRGRSGQTYRSARDNMQNYVAENPMVVGIVGLAAGLLLGALLPRTRREDEMFGEWADEVRNQGLRYAREATHRGREYLEENFSGDDAQFSRHESEFRPDRPDANRH